jgi:hypothetical protein
MEPPLSAYESAPVPPAVITEISPVVPPLQIRFTIGILLIVGAGASGITTGVESEHPFAS